MLSVFQRSLTNAYMSQSSKSSHTLLDTAVCCSNFTNGHCNVTLTNGLPCSGNVVLKYFQLTLDDVFLFSDSTVSAVSLYSSSIKLLPSAQLQFINNSALNGSALHIVDCSSLFVNTGAAILFKHNIAIHRGGAMLLC